MMRGPRHGWRHWTHDDDVILKGMWAKGATFSEIGRKLSRTDTSVRKRREVIGLPKRPPGLWTEKEKSVCLKLWGKGVNGTAIGRKLGKTRDSVLGWLFRGGHLGGNTHNRMSQTRKSRAPKPPRMPRQKVVVAPVESPPSLKLSILDVGPKQCRYIEGEPRGGTYCGLPVQLDKSYCPHHHQLCTRPMWQKGHRPANATPLDFRPNMGYRPK